MKKIIAGTLLSLLFSAAQAQESNVLQLFACNFHDGKTAENLWDVAERVRDLNTGPSVDELAGSFIWLPSNKLESAAFDGYEAFHLTTLRGGSGTFDWGWIGTNPDMASWAQMTKDYVGSSEGAAADARFEAISKCRSALWQGYWVTVPANRM